MSFSLALILSNPHVPAGGFYLIAISADHNFGLSWTTSIALPFIICLRFVTRRFLYLMHRCWVACSRITCDSWHKHCSASQWQWHFLNCCVLLNIGSYKDSAEYPLRKANYSEYKSDWSEELPPFISQELWETHLTFFRYLILTPPLSALTLKTVSNKSESGPKRMRVHIPPSSSWLLVLEESIRAKGRFERRLSDAFLYIGLSVRVGRWKGISI